MTGNILPHEIDQHSGLELSIGSTYVSRDQDVITIVGHHERYDPATKAITEYWEGDNGAHYYKHGRLNQTGDTKSDLILRIGHGVDPGLIRDGLDLVRRAEAIFNPLGFGVLVHPQQNRPVDELAPTTREPVSEPA